MSGGEAFSGIDGPLVSVVVPAFNAERYIRECLASLLSQSYTKVEIIVVDDGSTDRTAQVVKNEFPTVRYIFQENSGACSAPRNAGIRVAKGELVSFFDADDIMERDCIGIHVGALKGFPTAAFSLVNYQNFASTGGANIGPTHFDTCENLRARSGIGSEQPRVLIRGRGAREIIIGENFSIASGIVVRREVLDRVSGFDQALRASEDFDLAYRLLIEGDVAVNWPVSFRRRIHDANMSHQTQRILSEKILSRTKLAEIEPDADLKKLLITRLGDLYLAVAYAKEAFSRSKRLRALRNSVELSHDLALSHVKAFVKIVIGR